MYRLLMSGSTVGLFLQVVPITCLVGAIYAICRCVMIRKQGLSVAWGTEIMRWLFVCYLTGLVNLILVPSNFWTYIWFFLINGYSGGELAPLFSGEFDFVPMLFHLITGERTIGRWVLEMLVGNFLMFVPMGFFLPFVSNRVSKRNILMLSVVIPLVVESIQPIVGRSFDVDDLILNFAGIVVGYVIAVGIRSLTKYVRSQGERGPAQSG